MPTLKILFILLLIPITAIAQNCPVSMGGYCLETLWQETNKAMQTGTAAEASILEIPSPIQESVTSETTYYGYYETLWQNLVEKGLATDEENKKAFEEATKAGGTKIGGVNLVVLAARTLQKLVDLQVLTLDQAQKILNGAKTTPSP